MPTSFDHLDIVAAEYLVLNYTSQCPRLFNASNRKTETFIYLHITTSASKNRYGNHYELWSPSDL